MRRGRAAACVGSRGFTLLELLVVVLLIGLLVSIAVLGIQGRSQREIQEQEARRLLERMDLAREEAVLRAQSLGIRFEPGGYYFMTLRQDSWSRHQGKRMFQARELPEGLRLEVDIDGLDIALAEDDDDEGGDTSKEDGSESKRPQVFFLAGGEIVPDFAIRVIAEDTRFEYVIEPGDERWLELNEQRL